MVPLLGQSPEKVRALCTCICSCLFRALLSDCMPVPQRALCCNLGRFQWGRGWYGPLLSRELLPKDVGANLAKLHGTLFAVLRGTIVAVFRSIFAAVFSLRCPIRNSSGVAAHSPQCCGCAGWNSSCDRKHSWRLGSTLGAEVWPLLPNKRLTLLRRIHPDPEEPTEIPLVLPLLLVRNFAKSELLWPAADYCVIVNTIQCCTRQPMALVCTRVPSTALLFVYSVPFARVVFAALPSQPPGEEDG